MPLRGHELLPHWYYRLLTTREGQRLRFLLQKRQRHGLLPDSLAPIEFEILAIAQQTFLQSKMVPHALEH